MKKDGLEIVKALEQDSTPVKVYWHSKINQVGKFALMIAALQLTDLFDTPILPLCVLMFDFIDRHWIGERGDMRAVLAFDVVEWGEAASEQGPAAQSDD